MACQGDRVLDRRVAGADDDDVFGLVFVRIVELVLHPIPIVTGHAKAAQVTLQTDRQDNVVGRNGLTAAQGQPETALPALDRRYLGIEADVDTEVADLVVPSLEYRLAGAGLEGEAAA